MSHTEAAAAAAATAGNGAAPHHHKKLRKKRKQLDALVPEDKLRRKSSSSGSHHDLLYSDSDDVEFGGRGTQPLFGAGGLFGVLPGAFTLLVLVVTVVGLGATLKLLMTTRKDLDTLHMRFNAVEASGSELPAKFHESHVRLQMVEKNHSSIWTSLQEMSTDMSQVKLKLSAMETSLNTLEASLRGNPSLTALPNSVTELQKSVATFGASLQDVHTSFKATAEERDKMASYLAANDKTIVAIKKELSTLHTASFLPLTLSREGVSGEQSVAAAVHHINEQVSSLNGSVSALNSSFGSRLDASNSDQSKIFEEQLVSFTERIEDVETSLSSLPLQNLTWLPSEVKDINNKLDQFGNNLASLSNSINVVKGVEKKLEGSQVQMASGVSDLKQQIQNIEAKVATLRKPAVMESPPLVRRRRSVYEKFQNLYPSSLT